MFVTLSFMGLLTVFVSGLFLGALGTALLARKVMQVVKPFR